MGWGSVPARIEEVTPPGMTLRAASWSSFERAKRPASSSIRDARSGGLERGRGARRREGRGDLLAQLVGDGLERRPGGARPAAQHLDGSLVHLHELAGGL